ncbi:MAG TPA: hypothetical protein VFF72_06040 [Caldimonas sp.]|nr:hypothetical protein [Caldimonas sp.]
MRIVWIVFMGLAGLVGLGMSLCGGVFLLSTMSDPNGLMFIALGSLAVGALICFGAWRGLVGRPPPPDNAREIDRQA